MAKGKEASMADLSVEELKQRTVDLGKEIFSLRCTLAVQRKLEKPHLLKAKRKERARAFTFLTKKQKESVTR